MSEKITIALAKGRILDESVELFKKAGIDISIVMSDDRKLIYEDEKNNLRLMIVRSSDVPTYVEYGAADLGIAGKDVLMEQDMDLYEPLDLKIGYCRMVVCEPKELSADANRDDRKNWTNIRIATKFENITKKYFMNKGVQVDTIKLYGSIEIAPLLGLSERIVDLVQTGETLKQNGLVEVETIMDITSRLVCNRASLKTKPKEIKAIIEKLEKVV